MNGEPIPVPKHAIVLVFTPTSWARAVPRPARRPSRCSPCRTTLAEGDRVVTASHSVISDDDAFDHAVVRNVEVTVQDDDLAAIEVVQLDPAGDADTATLVVEGTATTELADSSSSGWRPPRAAR